jgi:tripartite-type tricarboxylate transporter receptor subunit TctC
MQMPLTRRAFGAVLLVPALGAQAQTARGKHYTLMVPYPAGGPADALARIINGPLSRELGDTVIVDNLGGASGAVAAQKTLSQPADGQLLLQASPNEVILAPAVNPAVKLRADDFRLLHPLVNGVLVLIARADLPASNADEFIALAKRRADKPLAYGSVGIGSLNHLIMEQVQRETATRFLHVPYKGNPPLLQDLGGGQIDVAVVVYSAALGALAEKGNLKLLGQFPPRRSALLPNVSALSEGAALRRLNFTTWSGVMVPKETPDATARRLNQAIAHVMQLPQVRDSLAAQSLEAAAPMSLEGAGAFYQSEIESYRAMLASINLKMQ